MISHFLLGFIVSFIGSLPLGVLNLSVIDITLKKNILQASYFILAASIIEFGQAFVALKFSSFITDNPIIEQSIKIGVIPIFLILGIYYLRQDNNPENTKRETISSFSKGIILAILNPLSIPFWLIWGTYFQLQGWLVIKTHLLLSFITGISLGTFIALLAYGYFALKIINRVQILNKRINAIIGFTLIGLALFQLLVVTGVFKMTSFF